MKIGIFGGSFNPPHKMHKKIALDLIKRGYVEKVVYVPTGNKYNKKDLIDAKERLKMLKIMTKDNNNLLVSDYELKNVLTYTYQTLDHFKRIYPNDEIYFICGTDNLQEIKTWRNYEYILDNYKLLVIKRNNDNPKSIMSSLNTKNIIIININAKDLSSTNVRKSLKEVGYSDDLDDEIMVYLRNRKLYNIKEEDDC